MKPNIFTNYWIIGLICFSLFAACLVMLFAHFNADEIEAMHTAWKIGAGERIYTDFFQHHHPLFYYLLLPLIFIFGETLVTLLIARWLIFAGFLVIVYLTFRTTELVFGRDRAWTAVLLLLTSVIFIQKAIEIRPDVPQTLFGLLAIYWLLIFYKKTAAADKTKCSDILKPLMGSAAALGLAFLFLQKAVFLAVTLGGLLLYDAFTERIAWKHVYLFAGAFLLTVSPFYVYLIVTGGVTTYLQLNWVLNLLFSPLSVMRWGGYTLAVNTVICLAYPVGLILLKTPLSKRLGIISLGLAASVAMVKLPFRQYFMPLFPVMAAVAAYALHTIKRKNLLLFALLVTMAVLTGLFSLLINLYYYPNGAQLTRIAFFYHMTETDDRVYTGGADTNLYRRDIDYFWFSLGTTGAKNIFSELTGYHYDIYELIEAKKPKIVADYLIDNMGDPRIAEHYEPSGVYNDIYIRKTDH